MKNQKEVVGDFWKELEAAEKVAVLPNEEGPCTITYTYGSLITLLCCYPSV